jgi:hypothetical protein
LWENPFHFILGWQNPNPYSPILQCQGYIHEADQQPMKEVSFKVH